MSFADLINSLEDDVLDNNTIPNDLYAKLDVKRGLRNADGTGVLAGLSQISSVKGVEKGDDMPVPVEGELRYRGYLIDELINTELVPVSKRHVFERVVFLLLIGRLPNEAELSALIAEFEAHATLPDVVTDQIIKGVPSPNIMNKLQMGVSALYGQDPEAETVTAMSDVLRAVRLIAKMPAIVAYSYLNEYTENPTFVSPKPGMSVAEGFLYMLHQGQDPSEFDAHIVDVCLALHAEHGGGNNSTFTTYVVSSSGTDIYSAIAAAISSLKGPLHGAANKKVMDMMADIKANVSSWTDEKEVSDYVGRIVKKEVGDHSGKIFGLGHAVYTKSDPRATVLRALAVDLAKDKGREDEFELYETIATRGPKIFNRIKQSSKVIAPNVDFFSGFVYDCLGIPQEVYTPMFAMARSAGWCAHRVEEILSGKRVIRPAYKFI